MDTIIKESKYRDDISQLMSISPYHIDPEIFTKEEIREIQHNFEKSMLVITQKFDEKRETLWAEKLKKMYDDNFRRIIQPRIKSIGLGKNQFMEIVNESEWDSVQINIIHELRVDNMLYLCFDQQRAIDEAKEFIEKKLITDEKYIGGIWWMSVKYLFLEEREITSTKYQEMCDITRWFLKYCPNIDYSVLSHHTRIYIENQTHLTDAIRYLVIYGSIKDKPEQIKFSRSFLDRMKPHYPSLYKIYISVLDEN